MVEIGDDGYIIRKPETHWCLSGACHGADVAWGKAAKQAGHMVIHIGFKGMKQSDESFHVLNPVELTEGDAFLKQANITLKRKYPTRSEYVNNLLRRNYWQIKDSQRVYAVAPINHNVVQGGTGWAVQMAIDKGIMEIYCFDLNLNEWQQWYHGHSLWMQPMNVPKPYGIYTGIGSREITEKGIKAINDIYAS